MLKKMFLSLSVGLAVAGASVSPAMAQSVEEVRPERVSVLSQEDGIGTDANKVAQAAPELEGAFSFQPLSQTEAASADASQDPSTEPSGTVEAAETTSDESSDFAGAVSAEADMGLVPRNNIVSASGLKRMSKAPPGAVRRPVAVMAGATSIPRPSAEGLTPREAQRLKSFDDFWLRNENKTDAGTLRTQEKEPETPAAVEEQEEIEETPSVPENEVDMEANTQQEKNPSASIEENSEAAEVEQQTEEITEEETVSPSDTEQTDVEIEETEEEKPSTSPETSNEEGALENQEPAPPEIEVLEDEIGEDDPLESIEEAEETGETPPELSISGGFTGIGGETNLEAAVGFVENDFAFEATSQTPVGGGETALGLEATLPLSDTTSLRVAAGDVSSETDTSLEAELSVQALQNLDVSVGLSDENRTSSPQINAGAVFTVLEGLELALGIDDIATEKVVDFETKFVRDKYELLARANNITGAPTFDIEASVQLNPIVTVGASIENLVEPIVDSSLEIKLDSYTLDFGVNDAFRDSSFDVQLRRTFDF